MKKTHAHITDGASPLRRYQEVIVGSTSTIDLMYFEWCSWLTYLPGAVGLALRKVFWPRLFASCGRGVMFGSGVILRHPCRIRLGHRVVVSDGCVFDGRCSQGDDAVVLGNDVMLSNNVMLSSKDGLISIGNNVGINAQTVIQSTNNCPVSIGNDCILGQGCLVIGGGSYDLSDPETLTRTSSIIDDGGVVLEDNVWLGGRVTVLGGVTVAQSSVVAAGAVVTRSLPPYSVSMGVPARVVRRRN